MGRSSSASTRGHGTTPMPRSGATAAACRCGDRRAGCPGRGAADPADPGDLPPRARHQPQRRPGFRGMVPALSSDPRPAPTPAAADLSAAPHARRPIPRPLPNPVGAATRTVSGAPPRAASLPKGGRRAQRVEPGPAGKCRHYGTGRACAIPFIVINPHRVRPPSTSVGEGTLLNFARGCHLYYWPTGDVRIIAYGTIVHPINPPTLRKG